MADNKSDYSSAASSARNSEKDMNQIRAYEKSRERHEKHVVNWSKNKVNLNEIVDKYAPGSKGKADGIKMIFYGKDYNVVTDLVSGYVRVYDNNNKGYINLNDEPDRDNKNTHFQIKKRKDM